MKDENLFVIIFFLLLLLCQIGMLSCSTRTSPQRCYDEVSKQYPDSIILAIPGESRSFIVRDPEDNIIYVETMGIFTPSVTKEKVTIQINDKSDSSIQSNDQTNSRDE